MSVDGHTANRCQRLIPNPVLSTSHTVCVSCQCTAMPLDLGSVLVIWPVIYLLDRLFQPRAFSYKPASLCTRRTKAWVCSSCSANTFLHSFTQNPYTPRHAWPSSSGGASNTPEQYLRVMSVRWLLFREQLGAQMVREGSLGRRPGRAEGWASADALALLGCVADAGTEVGGGGTSYSKSDQRGTWAFEKNQEPGVILYQVESPLGGSGWECPGHFWIGSGVGVGGD